MLPNRRACLALALLTLLGGCAQAAPPSQTQAAAADLDNLRAAAAWLGPEAAACAAAPPAGWSQAGLQLLAEQAPQWSAALEAEAQAKTAPPSQAKPAAGDCPLADLERDLARVETLSWRVAEARGDGGTVAVAIGRAARLAEAIGLGSLEGAPAPETADLANLPAETLASLALAQDQAGFVGEQLAAQTGDAALRAELEAAAGRHRACGEELTAMAGGLDLRAVAYQLDAPPADEAATRQRWAAVQLALASHYAALPISAGVEAWVHWQLGQAYAAGASLPALPFADPA
ncbi:MAG: hypothetical protein LBD90_06605 [Bifidobacteriaceae bacterium]|jgi:hypothetical protein|nr:hypothetical protein [Bifidobacteriaceae bacterium]